MKKYVIRQNIYSPTWSSRHTIYMHRFHNCSTRIEHGWEFTSKKSIKRFLKRHIKKELSRPGALRYSKYCIKNFMGFIIFYFIMEVEK